ncbi:MAG: TldD/PmbA family protein [Thermoproteus sp. AZ2]|jgi:TldD protein|uniref:TldD/PmbA family protein n=1 Tax=Thermoproteus sp. AZ2 TaxID=1609232 RepID=A0ACC6V274_9CREN
MEDLLSRAVDYALTLGAKYAEARWQVDKGRFAVVRNGAVLRVGEWSTGGISVRVVAGGLGFAIAKGASWEDVKAAVDSAYKAASASAKYRRRPIQFGEEKMARLKYEVPVKKPLEDLPQFLLGLDRVAQERGVAVRSFSASIWVTEKVVVNSDGALVESSMPRASLFAALIARGPNASLQRNVDVGGLGEAEALEEAPKVVAEEAAKVVSLAERARPVKPGLYDVVFSPELAGIFVHESVGHPFELDRIMGREGAEAGESYMSLEDLGKRIASEHVTIIDDPTIEAYGFYLVDEEGVPARPRRLIDRGVASEFLSNREYAAYVGRLSNAAARASEFDKEPIPRMSNTYLAPGDWDPEEIIRDTRRGIYVASYTEWNIDDRREYGRYGILEGYVIEDGELKEPVLGFIEAESRAFWSSVDAVGKDLKLYIGTCGKGNPSQGVPVTFGGPTFRARGIRVV